MTRPRRDPVIARTRAELAAALESLRRDHGVIALVPTMGAFHAGHLSLMDRAGELAGAVTASIFINPLQFGPAEDLDRYPRDLDRDVALAGERGVRVVFAPEEREMYPDGKPLVGVDPGPIGDRLCGPFRPGHFRGVLTVVCRLFGLFRPQVAVFGRKDLQQATLIGRMTRDLDLGVRVHVAPLVREGDGLAMSSRNRYLAPEERAQALGLFRALSAAEAGFRGGERGRRALLDRVAEVIGSHPGIRLEYSDLVRPDTLDPVDEASVGDVVAVAGICGSTRLIDNVVLGAERPDPVVSSDRDDRWDPGAARFPDEPGGAPPLGSGPSATGAGLG